MAHIVTAPLVIVNNTDGSHKYLYQGAVVPEFVSSDRLDELELDGFIEEVSAKEAATAPEPLAESN